jgi:esterase/lipase superfamily enzyme
LTVLARTKIGVILLAARDLDFDVFKSQLVTLLGAPVKIIGAATQ